MIAAKEAENAELVICLEGKIIDSNFDAFCEVLKAGIRELNYELKTDDDFDIAAENTKKLKRAEESLKAAKERALEQAADIQRLFAAIDDVSGEASQARLKLERQIKTRKEARRKEILDDAVDSLDVTLKASYRSRIEATMKGKRSFETMEQAAKQEVQTIQMEVNAARRVLESHREKHGSALIPDPEKLEQMRSDDVAVELGRRIERQKDEEERKRLRDLAAKAEIAAALSAKIQNSLPTAKEVGEAARGLQPLSPSYPVPGPWQDPPQQSEESSGKLSASEEMAAFLEVLKKCFEPARNARAELKHPENIAAAGEFARDLSVAWAKLKGGAK